MHHCFICNTAMTNVLISLGLVSGRCGGFRGAHVSHRILSQTPDKAMPFDLSLYREYFMPGKQLCMALAGLPGPWDEDSCACGSRGKWGGQNCEGKEDKQRCNTDTKQCHPVGDFVSVPMLKVVQVNLELFYIESEGP